MSLRLTGVLSDGEDGWVVATCPELGVVSQGRTDDEAFANLEEAVALWLDVVDDDELARVYRPHRVREVLGKGA